MNDRRSNLKAVLFAVILVLISMGLALLYGWLVGEPITAEQPRVPDGYETRDVCVRDGVLVIWEIRTPQGRTHVVLNTATGPVLLESR